MAQIAPHSELERRTIGFTELKDWLRHRHPMIYLDRVTDYEPGAYLESIMAVSGQVDAIAGHFPERAIFPASHMMQAISQSAIILYQLSTAKLAHDEITLIGSLKARFTRIVVPGDVLAFRTTIETQHDNVITFNCRAMVEEELVARVRGTLVRAKVSDLGELLW